MGVWLTPAEKQDTELQEKLKPMYREYKDKNYLVAIFQSGEQDLADAASDLLCYNLSIKIDADYGADAEGIADKQRS